MAKLLEINNSTGELQEFNPITVSTGVADANKAVQTNSAGYIDKALIDPSIVPDIFVDTAIEALSAGDFVNIAPTGVRKADRSNGRQADGFVLVAVANGAQATVYKDSKNTALSGLTKGSKYFLGTAGAVTTSVTTTAGEILQFLGVAMSASEIDVEINRPIVRA